MQLIVGSSADGVLVELVVLDPFSDDATVIHAMSPARDTFIPR